MGDSTVTENPPPLLLLLLPQSESAKLVFDVDVVRRGGAGAGLFNQPEEDERESEADNKPPSLAAVFDSVGADAPVNERAAAVNDVSMATAVGAMDSEGAQDWKDTHEEAGEGQRGGRLRSWCEETDSTEVVVDEAAPTIDITVSGPLEDADDGGKSVSGGSEEDEADDDDEEEDEVEVEDGGRRG